MNQIKVRAWTGKKMIYQTDIDPNFHPVDGHNKLYYRPISAMSGDSNDYIWMLYTGLEDSKGREIYDGDILKGKPHEGATVNRKGEVVFDKGRFMVVMQDVLRKLFVLTYRCRVIGNIYENPELLIKRGK